jgi:hypothetical protein
MKKIATIFVIIFSFSNMAYAAGFDWSPCKAEIDKLCKDANGDENIYNCLLKNHKELSKSCDDNGHDKYEKVTGRQ